MLKLMGKEIITILPSKVLFILTYVDSMNKGHKHCLLDSPNMYFTVQ